MALLKSFLKGAKVELIINRLVLVIQSLKKQGLVQTVIDKYSKMYEFKSKDLVIEYSFEYGVIRYTP